MPRIQQPAGATSSTAKSLNGTPRARVNQHVRRVVLYGRPASGKTCFLAALAMPREPHPMGHSCIWVCDSQTIPMPAGTRESWDSADPQVARYLGKEWLQRAIDAIMNGGVPRANPNDATPYRLLFDVTQTNGRIQRIEMVDYSGELVDPNLSEDVLARKLLQHLEEADGILVLAEAPRPGEKYYELYRELQILQQALMLVSNKRRQLSANPLPIGMLLNKWDRYSKMTEYDSEVARIEVDEFISQKPVVPQKALYSILQSVAGSLNGEQFSCVFPVSAFGKTRKISKEVNGSGREVEVPEELTPLPSYGLEDPLVWGCQRSDEMDMHELRTNVAGLAFWKIWQVPRQQALRVQEKALDLRKRLPSQLPEAKAIATLAVEAGTAFRRQLMALVAFACMVALTFIETGYLAYDSYLYTRIYPALRALETPEADPVKWAPDWDHSATFLAAYSKPSWYRTLSQLLLLSPTTAKDHHDRLQAGLQIAQHIIAVGEEFSTKYDSLATSAERSPDPANVNKLLADLEAMPLPKDARIADLAGGRKERAAKRIRDRLGALEVQIGTDQLTAKYNNEMREGRLPEAVAVLTGYKAEYPQVVAKLEGDFRNRWFIILNGRVVELANANNWGQVDTLIRKLRDDRGVIELVGFQDISRRCSECSEKVGRYRGEIAYLAFHSNPNSPSLREAVLLHGSDAHKTAVKKWVAYQEYLTHPKRWILKITGFATTNTGGWFGSTSYRLDARYDNKRIATTSFSASKGSVNYSLDVESEEISAKPAQQVSIDFDATTTNWETSNITFDGYWRGEPQALTSGATITIKTRANYPDPTIRIELRPVGFVILDAPSLPAPKDPEIR